MAFKKANAAHDCSGGGVLHDEHLGRTLASVNSSKISSNPTGTTTCATVVRIVVTPAHGRSGRYRARIVDHDQLLVGSSKQPFLDSARRLIQLGYDGEMILKMFRPGAERFDLRASIKVAAGLTVDEHNGTVFARWKPFCRSAVQPSSKRMTAMLVRGLKTITEDEPGRRRNE